MGEKREMKGRDKGRERRKEKRSKGKEKKIGKFTGAHTGATRIVHKIPIFGSSSGGCLQRIIVEKCLINTMFFKLLKTNCTLVFVCDNR